MKNMVSTLHSITIFTITIFLKKMVILKEDGDCENGR